jgi:hypothetical protein
MSNATHAYVGRAPCGCVRGLIVDDDAHKRDTSLEIGRWMRGDRRTPPWTIERVTIEEARKLSMRCTHDTRRQHNVKEPARQEAML